MSVHKAPWPRERGKGGAAGSERTRALSGNAQAAAARSPRPAASKSALSAVSRGLVPLESDLSKMLETVRPSASRASVGAGGNALFRQRAKQQKALSKPRPPPASEEEQHAANQERVRLHLVKQRISQERTRTLEQTKKRLRAAEEEAEVAKRLQARDLSEQAREAEKQQQQQQEGTPPTLMRSSSSFSLARSRADSARQWVERLQMPCDFEERLWDGNEVRRDVRNKRIMTADPEDGVLVYRGEDLGDQTYALTDPEYWRGYRYFLEPCGEGASKKAYRIMENAWGDAPCPDRWGKLIKAELLMRGRSKYEQIAAVVTRAERKVDKGVVQKGDPTIDVRLELHNTLRAAVASIGPPVVMGRAVPIEGANNASRLVLLVPFCETLDEALEAADEPAALELWASTERLMLKIALGRLVLADFKPGNLLVRRTPNKPPHVWCSDFDDTLTTWDVDMPPLLIAAAHMALLGMHLVAQRDARVANKSSKAVCGIETWIPLVRSHAKALLEAVKASPLEHTAAHFCFPRQYLVADSAWSYGRSKHSGLAESFDKLMWIMEGYFRKHKPYAEMPVARRLFAAWAREDPMIQSMLTVVLDAQGAAPEFA